MLYCHKIVETVAKEFDSAIKEIIYFRYKSEMFPYKICFVERGLFC
jgi:hypothetical protein